MARNARFWTWVNDGWVKITLRPDQSLSHHTGGATDEGFSYTVETWSFDGQLVECETNTTARDCDGRLDNTSIYVCPVADLRARDVYEESIGWSVEAGPEESNRGIFAPEWKRRTAWQRDYEAEAAGY